MGPRARVALPQRRRAERRAAAVAAGGAGAAGGARAGGLGAGGALGAGGGGAEPSAAFRVTLVVSFFKGTEDSLSSDEF